MLVNYEYANFKMELELECYSCTATNDMFESGMLFFTVEVENHKRIHFISPKRGISLPTTTLYGSNILSKWFKPINVDPAVILESISFKHIFYDAIQTEVHLSILRKQVRDLEENYTDRKGLKVIKTRQAKEVDEDLLFELDHAHDQGFGETY